MVLGSAPRSTHVMTASSSFNLDAAATGWKGEVEKSMIAQVVFSEHGARIRPQKWLESGAREWVPLDGTRKWGKEAVIREMDRDGVVKVPCAHSSTEFARARRN